mgnify:CR=1 FL=1
MKSATVRARIEPSLKDNVDHILEVLGMSTTEAITIFYKQIELQRGLPFKVSIPNKETIQALEDAEKKESLTRCENTEDMFNKLGI